VLELDVRPLLLELLDRLEPLDEPIASVPGGFPPQAARAAIEHANSVLLNANGVAIQNPQS